MSRRVFDGKPFKSVTQGAADLALIPLVDAKEAPAPELQDSVKKFLVFMKSTLGDAVAEVRASDRLTDSAVCLVAPDRAGPGAGKDSGRGRAAERRLEADPGGQSAPSACGRARGARRRRANASRKTRRICCSTRRACSRATGRRMRARSPSGSRACWRSARGRAVKSVCRMRCSATARSRASSMRHGGEPHPGSS